MKKFEEPSSSMKSQTQIEETQVQEEEVIGSIYLSQTDKNDPPPIQTATTTTLIRKDELGIQTGTNQDPSSKHDCCQDISTCPCVLR
jgi:hypothetical protein